MKYMLKTRHKEKLINHQRVMLISCAVLFLLGLGLLGMGTRIWVPARQKQPASSIPSSAHTNVQNIAMVPHRTDAPAFGIAAGSSLTTLSSAQLAQRLDGIRDSGAQWIRLDFDWSLVQPQSQSQYNWSAYDTVVTAIAQRHLSILAILDYTPQWARPDNCRASSQCAPANPDQFATFAAAAAKQYDQRGVHFWEIWNEPNNKSFWQPASDPARYTAMLRKSYNALHTADPQAYVVTAGLSPQDTADGSYAPYDFLASIYANGGRGSFDAVADHPYTFPLSPTSNADDAWTQMASISHSLRSLMVANGDGNKKIWVTEFGAPTGGPGPVATLQNPNLAAHPYVVDEALQAKILSDAVQLYHNYSWAGPFFYYTYQDPGTDTSTNEDFFGLVTSTGAQKPAYAVFRTAAFAIKS